MKYQQPRGTHDVLPTESHRWHHIERVFQGLVELAGYQEIRTPMFEDTDLFVRSSGETSDIVSKEMYQFRDKGDRELCLKPEGTAPAIRSYLEHKFCVQGAVCKLWYCAPIFRYDRPAKGRYRQSHQLGIELIGASGPQADVEVISLVTQFFQKLGLQSQKLKINSIGRVETRERYRDILLSFAEPYLNSVELEVRARAEANPLRMLDFKDPKAIEHFADAPKVLDFLERESQEHFEAVQERLTQEGVDFEIDPRIVRGLDYYNDTVFEVTTNLLGAQSSICGGGRYDQLVKKLGGPPTPCFGVGIGMERTLMTMEEESLEVPEKNPPVFVAYAEPRFEIAARKLVRKLRDSAVTALYSLDPLDLKRQLKAADRAGAKQAWIIGLEDNPNSVTKRDLASGEQTVEEESF